MQGHAGYSQQQLEAKRHAAVNFALANTPITPNFSFAKQIALGFLVLTETKNPLRFRMNEICASVNWASLVFRRPLLTRQCQDFARFECNTTFVSSHMIHQSIETSQGSVYTGRVRIFHQRCCLRCDAEGCMMFHDAGIDQTWNPASQRKQLRQ